MTAATVVQFCKRHPRVMQTLSLHVRRSTKIQRQGLLSVQCSCNACKAEWQTAVDTQRRNHDAAPAKVPIDWRSALVCD